MGFSAEVETIRLCGGRLTMWFPIPLRLLCKRPKWYVKLFVLRLGLPFSSEPSLDVRYADVLIHYLMGK